MCETKNITFIFHLRTAQIYNDPILDISNDELWRLRAHRLVVGIASRTQNSWLCSTFLKILGPRGHDDDQSMSTKSPEFVVWDIYPIYSTLNLSVFLLETFAFVWQELISSYFLKTCSKSDMSQFQRKFLFPSN